MKPVRFELTAPDLSAWRIGNTGVEGLWHFDSGQPGRRVLISALVHGNEWCGAWAIKELLESGLRPQVGQLTLMLANLAAFDRFDPQQPDRARFVDEDMNRQWSPERIAQTTSAERRRVAQLVPWVAQADWLLDLHSMHEPGPPLLLTGLQTRHLELARALDAPAHIVRDAGHSDGVRMRDFGRFAEPEAPGGDTRSLLIECGFHGDPDSVVVARDLCARFLQAAGVVEPGASQATQRHVPFKPWVLEVTGAVVARSERFRFSQPWQALSCIESAGTVIADNDGEPVRTPHDQCVLVMPSVRQARAGVTVVRFARRL
jgi:predicted deacylase